MKAIKQALLVILYTASIGIVGGCSYLYATEEPVRGSIQSDVEALVNIH